MIPVETIFLYGTFLVIATIPKRAVTPKNTYDTGVRNALIGDFSDLESRTDKGALFENFIISELIKQDSYSDKNFKFYYWRTKQGSEIDVVLEKGNELIGVEVKYKRKAFNKAFKNRYPEAKIRLVTADNFY